MKVAYSNNPYVNGYQNNNSTSAGSNSSQSKVLSYNEIANKISDNPKTTKTDSLSTSSPTFSTDNLISSSERNFFKDLFPDRADQIDKHTLFNRNGKVSQQYTTKGLIIDGRI